MPFVVAILTFLFAAQAFAVEFTGSRSSLIHNVNVFSESGVDPLLPVPLTGKISGQLLKIGRIDSLTLAPSNDPTNIDPATGKRSLVYGHGTFFNVSPCLIMTAYHVVHGSAEEPNRDAVAELTYRQADGRVTTMRASPVAWMTSNWGDIVLMKSGGCAGKDLGYFDLDTLTTPSFYSGAQVLAPGFPANKSPTILWAHKCDIISFAPFGNPYSFEHNCSTRQGQSGSPVIVSVGGKLKVIAISVEDRSPTDEILKHFDPDHANLATTMTFLSSTMKALIAEDIRVNGNP